MTTVYSLRYLRSVSYHAAQLLVLARRLYVCVCIICVCTFVFDVRVYMYMCLCFFAIPRFGEIKLIYKDYAIDAITTQTRKCPVGPKTDFPLVFEACLWRLRQRGDGYMRDGDE